LLVALSCTAYGETVLRVCADPENLPFSDRNQEGFENRIAELLARTLNTRLEYVWQRMGRGFVREYLDKAACDLLIGVPAGYRPVLTTSPYYRSSFFFVVRRDRAFKNLSFDTAALQQKKIGVQVVGEEYAPPATILARHGLQNEIVPFDTTGAHAGLIVDAVASRAVDLSIVWGPFAGYFARKYGDTLDLIPAVNGSTSTTGETGLASVPLSFAIAMGVRKGNTELRDRIEQVLRDKRKEIQAILKAYAVPVLSETNLGVTG
jgi:mxaJ protein